MYIFNTMKLKHFYIHQKNNKLEIFEPKKQELLFSSYWFMEFGKTCAEIHDVNNKLIYSVTKRFQFWKWRMVYLIYRNVSDKSYLISQNIRNTIFKIELLSGNYEIRVHYQNKKSIYKDDVKIAEIDESFSENEYVKLLVVDEDYIKMIFLLYTCLLIGEKELTSKSVIKSQKRLETNEEPWS